MQYNVSIDDFFLFIIKMNKMYLHYLQQCIYFTKKFYPRLDGKTIININLFFFFSSLQNDF